MCFSCGWTFQASHEKKHKKNTRHPHPPNKFCGVVSEWLATFFRSPHHCTGGGGIFYTFFMRGGKFSAAILCFCKMHFSWKIMLQISFVSYFVKIYVFEKCVFLCIKHDVEICFQKSATLFFPTLGSGRKNKVTPWRVLKASALLSLLKFHRTCVQESVFWKSMCTFLQCRTLVT